MSAVNNPGSTVMRLLKSGLAAPLMVIAMLAMVMVPLPPLVLDMLFTFNIAISLVVMMGVVYVKRPLDFSIFPTVLLTVTLLRLALNVASTRVVLLHGHNGGSAAGHVIESFGQFVIGGSYAVGIVVFAILTIVNFVVVTKGAGRISEVSARFILDALPGKQMAIDADLNGGVITREEAKRRRQEVRDESDFYGSMDGASKFVRGDAIAGILILVINIVGGILIGITQHGMGVADASQTYLLLAIGDGLVAQLPALLIATAVAMLVTRSTGEVEMGDAVSGQVFGHARALTVTAALLGIVGVVPGMPNVPFLILAAITGFLAWRQHQKAKQAPESAETESEPGIANAAVPELSWDEVRPVEPLALDVGYKLIPLVDKGQGGELLARIKGIRRKLTNDLGFLIPAVHVRDNLELPPGQYRLLIHGVPLASGDIHPDRHLALDPAGVLPPLEGIPGRDPAFGLEAIWIAAADVAHAESLGYTVVDASTVIATHLSHVVREHAPELLGHEETQQLLNTVARHAPKLVEDLTPKLLPMSTVVRVLQSLLAERVPIRQTRQIVEALLEHGAASQDPAQLTAAVRVALGRFIVQELNGVAAELPVYTLAPELERVLQDSVSGQNAALEPGLAERLHQNLSECVTRQESLGEPVILLVPGSLRASLARLVRHSIPSLSVLAFGEVPEDKRLRLVGAVG